MNQQETIFDGEFEKQILPRRRDILPKWLVVYMWIMIIFGLGMLCYAGWSVPEINPNDAMANDPEKGGAYRIGLRFGQYLPGILIVLMGELVRSERRRAIRFNWGVAIFWTTLVIYMVLIHGLRGLTMGVLVPLFVPYWIGLFRLQRTWEKGAVRR